MAAISYDGVLGVRLKQKTFNRRRFIRFLADEVVPSLEPYNGINSNSVLVMGK